MIINILAFSKWIRTFIWLHYIIASTWIITTAGSDRFWLTSGYSIKQLTAIASERTERFKNRVRQRELTARRRRTREARMQATRQAQCWQNRTRPL